MSKLWGGRFEKEPTQAVEQFTESVSTDARMIAEDIWGSQAHAIMLAAQEIISQDDLRQILTWLEKAREELQSGKLQLKPELEDVHMNVEDYLIKGAGIDSGGKLLGGKLHTARSRNDQVVTDTRMHARIEILEVLRALLQFQQTLLRLAEQHADAPWPGYTHVQHAQPITLGFWLSAHASVLSRDGIRLLAAYDRTNQNPLGACALAGTSFPTDRQLTTRLLGFDQVLEHSLDAVSSRDFAAETLSAIAILMCNLSRLAEEIIYWSSGEFSLIELDDAYATGSSIMPQKKNPCVAELIRSRTGRAYGALIQMLTTLKGLPSGYNRDLQEDREALWKAFDNARECLVVLDGMMSTLTFKADRMRELAAADFSTATELANFLVRERGLTFRESHEIVGRTVGELARSGKDFSDLEATQKLLAKAGAEISTEELRSLLDLDQVIASYQSLGSSSPQEVQRMIADLQKSAQEQQKAVEQRQSKLDQAHQLTQSIVKGVLANKDLSTILISK